MPSLPGYYKVTVNTIFSAYNDYFTPGVIYWVTAEQYNGQIADGRNFKDLCAQAQLEQPITQ